MSTSFLNKSLAELDVGKYGVISSDGSSLMARINYLQRKKLIDFSVEDLRLMIGQRQGLDYLIPLALEKLRNNPFEEGDYYEGDLLVNVLKSPCLFWKDHPEHINIVQEVIETAIIEIDAIDIIEKVKKLILESIESYKRCIAE